MKAPSATPLPAEPSGTGYSSIGSQSGGENEGAGEGPISPGAGTDSPVYDDEEKRRTLTEDYQAFLSTISTGTLGGNFMNGSLQPEAPQAPGNVLTGRFGNALQGRGKWVLVAVVIVALVWWIYRKRG